MGILLEIDIGNYNWYQNSQLHVYVAPKCNRFLNAVHLCAGIQAAKFHRFLAKRDYMANQSICLSVVSDVRAPYSGGLTLRGYFYTIL